MGCRQAARAGAMHGQAVASPRHPESILANESPLNSDGSRSTPESHARPIRCEWAKTELSIAYHDDEWGVPQHDDRRLFEFLILEGARRG